MRSAEAVQATEVGEHDPMRDIEDLIGCREGMEELRWRAENEKREKTTTHQKTACMTYQRTHK